MVFLIGLLEAFPEGVEARLISLVAIGSKPATTGEGRLFGLPGRFALAFRREIVPAEMGGSKGKDGGAG